MIPRFFVVLALVAVVSCQNTVESYQKADPRSGSGLSGVSVSNGYQLSANLDKNLNPNGFFNLYGSGQLGSPPGSSSGQPQPQYNNYASTNEGLIVPGPLSTFALWSPTASTVLTGAAYFAAGVAAAISVWYSCAVLGHKSLDDLKEVKKGDEKVEKAASSRKRRSVKNDDYMNNLTEMVLSAISSGECLQKSICLMASQVDTRKGRMAALVLDQVIPANLQESPYYVTFRNGLKGVSYCRKMACKH